MTHLYITPTFGIWGNNLLTSPLPGNQAVTIEYDSDVRVYSLKVIYSDGVGFELKENVNLKGFTKLQILSGYVIAK